MSSLEDSAPCVLSGCSSLSRRPSSPWSDVLKPKYNLPIKHRICKCSARWIFTNTNFCETSVRSRYWTFLSCQKICYHARKFASAPLSGYSNHSSDFCHHGFAWPILELHKNEITPYFVHKNEIIPYLCFCAFLLCSMSCFWDLLIFLHVAATCSFYEGIYYNLFIHFFSIERSYILNDEVLIFGKFSVERERKLILLKQKYCQRCDIKTCRVCLVLSQDLGGEM